MFPDYFEDDFFTSKELEYTEITSCQNKKNNENEVQSVPDIDFLTMPQVSHQPVNSYYSEKLTNYNDPMSKSNVKSSLSIDKEIPTNSLFSTSKNSIESLNQSTLFCSSVNSKKHLNKNGNPKKKPGRKVKVPDFLLPPEKEHQYLKNIRKCLMEEKNKLQEMLCSHEQNNYCMFKLPIENSLPINK